MKNEISLVKINGTTIIKMRGGRPDKPFKNKKKYDRLKEKKKKDQQ